MKNTKQQLQIPMKNIRNMVIIGVGVLLEILYKNMRMVKNAR